MAAKLKIPWTRRDQYKYLKFCEESQETSLAESDSSSSCVAFGDETKGHNGSDNKEINSFDGSKSGSNMQPLVYPTRFKSKYQNEHPAFGASNGAGSRLQGGDFVDMPTTRDHITVRDGGVFPAPTPQDPLKEPDELDSPTKPSSNNTIGDVSKKKAKKKLSSKQFSRDHVDYELGRVSFTNLDILFYVFSMGSYLVDVGSDCWVAYMYYSEGHWMWFSLTVTFITVPAILMTAFSMKWYYIDHKHDKKNSRKSASPVRWVSRFMFLMLQLSPLLRYMDSLIYGCKSRRLKHPEQQKQKLHWYHMMLYEDTDSSLLRLIECFMEAAPQLVLQLYIMCTLGAKDGVLILVGQGIASFTSLCSLAWSLTAYHKALRASLPHKNNMSYAGMALQFFWRFFVVAARVIALAMFASRFKAWVFVVIASHWVTMFIWIRIMQTSFCDTRLEEFGFNGVCAAIYIFCYLNLIEGRTRLRYLFYYIITFLEDGALISVWYLLTQTRFLWYQNPAICTVFGGYVIGITFQIVYYLKFHPNNIASDKSRAIKWIPLKELCSGTSRPERGGNNLTELQEPAQVRPTATRNLEDSSNPTKSPESVKTASSTSEITGLSTPLIRNRETNV